MKKVIALFIFLNNVTFFYLGKYKKIITGFPDLKNRKLNFF